MKKITMMVLILVMTSGIVWGARGGEEWDRMTEREKAYWIKGIAEGNDLGWMRGLEIISDFMTRKSDKAIASSDSKMLDMFDEFGGITSVFMNETDKSVFRNSKQLRKGMNEFYKDYRNQNIELMNAVCIVKMEMEGQRAELIKAGKRYLRSMKVSKDPEEDLKKTNPFYLGKLKGIDYSNPKDVQEKGLKYGVFVEPKIEKPNKYKDYNMTKFFRYGLFPWGE